MNSKPNGKSRFIVSLIRLLQLCCLAILLSSFTLRLHAQVLDLSQYRSTLYYQTGPAPPTTPNSPYAYYFASYVDADSSKALEYSPFMVYTASDSPTNSEFVMFEASSYSFYFFGAFYADKEDFDADYPNGTYNYVTTYSDPTDDTPKSDNVLIQTPDTDLYSPTIPAFSPNCWPAMQGLDPSADFTLSWNSYSLTPGASYAVSFLYLYDNQTLDSTYGGFNYYFDPTITSYTIPAGTLDYGRTYTVDIYFSNRATSDATNEDGSDVGVTIGYDNITSATLVTIAPSLQIVPSPGNSVTLSWPALATNYVLQTTPALTGPGGWNNVTNVPSTAGSISSLTLPANQPQAFFRLAPQ